MAGSKKVEYPLPPNREPSTEGRIENAIAELKRRGVKSDYCPRCDTSDWNVDLLEIPANSALSKLEISIIVTVQAYYAGLRSREGGSKWRR